MYHLSSKFSSSISPEELSYIDEETAKRKSSSKSVTPISSPRYNNSSSFKLKVKCHEEDLVQSPGPHRQDISTGSLWSNEMNHLSQCGSSYEAAICLERIKLILDSIKYEDRINFCKEDFDLTINRLLQKSGPKYFWNSNLRRLIREINEIYFNENCFRRLPTDLIEEIFLWIETNEMLPILCTSYEWLKIGSSDKLWKLYYHHRYVRFNPNSDLPNDFSGNYKIAFQQRLLDPFVGDKVEVAWKGRFRLEASDVYQGKAWWIAEVVDKHSSQQKYKIKYPGWDDRWDEWVPISRLRWKVEKNLVVQIRVNDSVEVWCVGSTVPGAWLETVVVAIEVSQVDDTISYCVGGVCVTGDLWVERSRLRLVKFKNLHSMAHLAALSYKSNENVSPPSSSPGQSDSRRNSDAHSPLASPSRPLIGVSSFTSSFWPMHSQSPRTPTSASAPSPNASFRSSNLRLNTDMTAAAAVAPVVGGITIITTPPRTPTMSRMRPNRDIDAVDGENDNRMRSFRALRNIRLGDVQSAVSCIIM